MPRRDPIKLVSSLPKETRRELFLFLSVSESQANSRVQAVEGLEATLDFQKGDNRGRPH